MTTPTVAYYWCAWCDNDTMHKTFGGVTWCAECGEQDKQNGADNSERP